MRANTRLAAATSIFVLGAVAALFVGSYFAVVYHESVNQSIYAKYGIQSRVDIFFPSSKTMDGYWQNMSTVQAAGETVPNATQAALLSVRSPGSYSALLRAIAANEAPSNQSSQDFWFLVPPFIALVAVFAALVAKWVYQPIDARSL